MLTHSPNTYWQYWWMDRVVAHDVVPSIHLDFAVTSDKQGKASRRCLCSPTGLSDWRSCGAQHGDIPNCPPGLPRFAIWDGVELTAASSGWRAPLTCLVMADAGPWRCACKYLESPSVLLLRTFPVAVTITFFIFPAFLIVQNGRR
jgi:hypothetical protein